MFLFFLFSLVGIVFPCGDRSVKLSVNQSVNPSTGQSIDQSIERSMVQKQYETTCCTRLVVTDAVKNRVGNDDIFYTKPEIKPNATCELTQIDCKLPNLDNEVYYLIQSDGNGTIMKSEGSLTPYFNISTANLTCESGYNDIYFSCEQGCSFEVCGHIKDCSCPPLKNFVDSSSLPGKEHLVKQLITDDNCQNITVECEPPNDPNKTITKKEVYFYDQSNGTGEKFVASELATPGRDAFTVNIKGLKCLESKWYYGSTLMKELYATCELS